MYANKPRTKNPQKASTLFIVLSQISEHFFLLFVLIFHIDRAFYNFKIIEISMVTISNIKL